jgi:branched-chain amino acid transport system permease protein
MNLTLFANQLLNGVQYGLVLFLLSAGLSLVFGIMNVLNLAHGALYMMGAYACALVATRFDSYPLGLIAGVVVGGVLGLAVERLWVRKLYGRDHLEQVLATFGLVLCFQSASKFFWGPSVRSVPLPSWLSGEVSFGGMALAEFRLFVVAAGLFVALLLWLLITRTRAGMLVRASASDEWMARSLGVRTRIVFAAVFTVGAVLAALAGGLIAPITGVSNLMGDSIVIIAFVVIIIGGVGSVRGAFVASVLIGVIDTLGRAYLSDLIARIASASTASAAGPAMTSILIYLVMASVLLVKPAGLFPPSSR